MDKFRIEAFLRNILLSILSLILILLLFEIGLRVLWKMSALKGQLYINSSNFNLRYELKPNPTKGINSDGFRDSEYPLSKDEGTMRIIVLGDSETLSISLALEDTFPKKLQKALNEKCAEYKFEALNMGVQGYNTTQELEFLRVKGLKYNPDLVLLYYCFNDSDQPEYYFKKNFLNTNFLLPRYIQYRIKKFLVKRDRKLKSIKNEEENFRYLYNSQSWDYTKEAILNIKGLSEKYNFRFVFVVVAEMSSFVLDFHDNYPYGYINEMLARFCNDNGIEIIDPMDHLRERGDKPLDLVIGFHDRYKNPKANSIIAAYVADELMKRKIISCQ